MVRTKLLVGCLSLALVIPAVTAADPWKDESGHGRGERGVDYSDHWENDDRRGDRDDIWRPGDRIPPLYPPRRVDRSIPPGHLPPPGECRIWFPGRPAGHQPPPGSCRELRFQVPPGAFLVRG